MIRAQSADGAIHEFPDGTPDSVVDGAMRRYVQEAAPKATTAPKAAATPNRNVLAGLGKSALAGVQRGATAIAGLPGDLIQGAAGDAVESALGLAGMITGRKPPQGAKTATKSALSAFAPSGEKLDRDRQAALGPDYAPKTAGEKLARTAGEFAGNALVPGGIVRKAASVLAPAVLSEGAGQASRGKPWEGSARIAGALAGSLGAAGLTRGAGEVAKAAKPKSVSQSAPKAVPTLEELKTARTAAYKAVDQSGVRYTPDAFKTLAADIRTDLTKANIDVDLHPAASKMLANIEKRAAAGESPTLTELDQLRQVVGRDVAGKPDKAEKFMGRRMVDQIDRFVDATGPGHVTGGAGPEAAATLRQARDLHTRVSKLEAVDTAVKKAKKQAGKASSGGNKENALRQQIDRVAEKTRNLTPEERTAFDTAVMGTPTQNVLRQVGKLSPQGNGLMMFGQIAALPVTGGASAGLAAAGAGAKIAAEVIGRRNVDQIVKVIARGGEGSAETQRLLAQQAAIDARSADLYRLVMSRLKKAPALPALSTAHGARNTEVENRRSALQPG